MRTYISLIIGLCALALLGAITHASYSNSSATPPPGTFAARVWLPITIVGRIDPIPTSTAKCDAFGETFNLGNHVSPDGDIGPEAEEIFVCHWAYFFSKHWKVDENRLTTFHWQVSNKCDQSWVRFAPTAEDPDRFRAYPKGYKLTAFAVGDGMKWIAGWDKDLPIDPQRFGGYVLIRASDPCW